MEKIKIGKITSPVGLKGEVKIMSYSEDPDRFEILEGVYFADESFHEILGVRYKGPSIILTLEGIDDRTAAERARGTELFMNEEDLPELPRGSYYVRDIVGFSVCTEEGKTIGTLKDVLTNTGQDLYVVKGEEKDILIPGAKEIVKNIDVEKGVITVDPPEGLLEL